MKKGDKKFVVIWDNPRRVEEAEYLYTEKGFHRLRVLSDKQEVWRKEKMIFDDLEGVNEYLEIEDRNCIH